MKHIVLVAIALTLVACTTPAAKPNGAVPESGQTERQTSRTLNSVMRVEPASLAAKSIRPTGISVAHAVRLFNA
jgi:hypothetical protein